MTEERTAGEGEARKAPAITIARGADGLPVSIEAARNGAASGCTCYGCREPLIARQGEQRTWSFAHGSGSACGGGGPETRLHEIAKTLFEREGRFALPEAVAIGRVLVPAAERHFAGYGDSHRLFPRLCDDLGITGFRPDAIGFAADGPDADGSCGDGVGVNGRGEVVLMEFRVTHAVDATKRAKAEALGLAMVEIDLSGLVHRDLSPLMAGGDPAARDALVRAILMDAPRQWIHHPAIEAERRARIEAEQAHRAAEAVAWDGDLVGHDLPGQDAMAVPARVWQMATLAALADRAGEPVPLDRILGTLRERGMAPAPETAAPAGSNSRNVERFDPARRAVRLYLTALGRLGVAQADPRDPDVDADALDWGVTPNDVAAQADVLEGRSEAITPVFSAVAERTQDAADRAWRNARIAALKASMPGSPEHRVADALAHRAAVAPIPDLPPVPPQTRFTSSEPADVADLNRRFHEARDRLRQRADAGRQAVLPDAARVGRVIGQALGHALDGALEIGMAAAPVRSPAVGMAY